MIPLSPRSTLFHYTTLFRSQLFRERLQRTVRPGREDQFGEESRHVQTRTKVAETRLGPLARGQRSEVLTSELQSHVNHVCRRLLEKKKSPTSSTHSTSLCT